MSEKFILPDASGLTNRKYPESALEHFVYEWSEPNGDNTEFYTDLTKAIEEVLANHESELKREWSNRFGFMAVSNSSESFKSIDEVADILNRKQAGLEAEKERLKGELETKEEVLTKIIESANNAGWNGVTNPKAIWDFITHQAERIEMLKQRADRAEKAERQAINELKAVNNDTTRALLTKSNDLERS